MLIKNFWSNEEIHEFYKDHPLKPKIYECEYYWFVEFNDKSFHLCEKDENFKPNER